jgi:hypothetical protein
MKPSILVPAKIKPELHPDLVSCPPLPPRGEESWGGFICLTHPAQFRIVRLRKREFLSFSFMPP